MSLLSETRCVVAGLPHVKLDRAEETTLARRIRKGPGKQAAIDRLVLWNLREATIYTMHYVPHGRFAEGEIMSLCYDVLVKSAPRFLPCFGIRFVAFAKNRLRGAIKRHMTTLDTVKHASVKRTDSIGGPTFLPFTGGMDVVNHKMHGLESNEYETCTQGGVEDFDFVGVGLRECGPSLKSALGKLNPRQRMILRLVYDLGFNMQEIGDMLAVSRSAVQMTHSSALTTLRRYLGENMELFFRQ